MFLQERVFQRVWASHYSHVSSLALTLKWTGASCPRISSCTLAWSKLRGKTIQSNFTLHTVHLLRPKPSLSVCSTLPQIIHIHTGMEKVHSIFCYMIHFRKWGCISRVLFFFSVLCSINGIQKLLVTSNTFRWVNLKTWTISMANCE